jgi:hypothetical protein
MNLYTNRAHKQSTGPIYYRPGQGQCHSLLKLVLLIGIATVFIAMTPVSAGEQYMAGSPLLSASLAGTNEFSPGQDAQIAVVIENSGVNEFKFAGSGIVNRDDLPNTAKFLSVTLEPGDTRFIIKSDPQSLGDLKASSTATGRFTVRIPSDTPSGVYNLPVMVNYTYLFSADQYGTDTIQYDYKTKTEEFQLPITIKPDVRINVSSIETNGMNVGTEGSIQLVVKNIGHENARKAIVTISRNDGSPVIPTAATAYIGDFPSGGTATCFFKASVAENAEAQSFPLDVYVKYKNQEDDYVSSDIETIGIPVGKKIDFAIISDPVSLIPGEKKVITVQYKNTGGAVAHQAQARVSLVDPFTSSDDTSYLGDVAPGEVKEASFLISVDKAATLKQYGIDSEIRYRDVFDNMIISDPVKVGLNVSEDKGLIAGLMKNPVILVVVVLVIFGIGYVGYSVYRKREKR